jgi:hypothetical protein
MLVVVSTRSSLDEALQAADAVGNADMQVDGLATPLDAKIRARVDEAWDLIRGALVGGVRWGADRSRDALDAALVQVERITKEAGARAREIEEAVLAKLREFVQKLIDGALHGVQDSLVIGTKTMALTTVEVRQKITLGGSLHASITDVWELASTAELEVSASYALAPIA